jgi:hypothetical protein
MQKFSVKAQEPSRDENLPRLNSGIHQLQITIRKSLFFPPSISSPFRAKKKVVVNPALSANQDANP